MALNALTESLNAQASIAGETGLVMKCLITGRSDSTKHKSFMFN